MGAGRPVRKLLQSSRETVAWKVQPVAVVQKCLDPGSILREQSVGWVISIRER